MSHNLHFLAMASVLLLAACSQPDQRTIAVCRETASQRAQGYHLQSSDLGELVEECMLAKGYRLSETGKLCSDDLASATSAKCYYRQSYISRFINWAGTSQ
jgi:uncharacterized lipoprotein YajG